MESDGGWAKTLRNFGVEAKRATERATVNVMKKVGIASGPVPGHDPDFDYLAEAYASQSAAMRALRAETLAAFDALKRVSSTGHALAVGLGDGLAANADVRAKTAADALLRAQEAVADDVLRRVERRVERRVIGPVEEEVSRAREVSRGLEGRKRVAADAARYITRVEELGGGGGISAADLAAVGTEDARKGAAKLDELQAVTESLRDAMAAALPRRARLIEGCVAETIEFQRKFFMDAARTMDRCVDVVGVDVLADMRIGNGEAEDGGGGNGGGGGGVPSQFRTNVGSGGGNGSGGGGGAATGAGSKARPDLVDDEFFQFPASTPAPAQKTALSIWDENDGSDDEVEMMGLGLGQSPPPSPSPDEPPVQRRASSGYPSGGVGARESAGVYPNAGVGTRESVYPPTRSASRPAKPPSRPVSSSANTGAGGSGGGIGGGMGAGGGSAASGLRKSAEGVRKSASREAGLGGRSLSSSPTASGDLLGGLADVAPLKKSASRKTSQPPAAPSVDDLMGFSASGSKTSVSSATAGASTAAAAEGDLLGVFASPTSSMSKTAKSSSRSSRANGRGGLFASSPAASGLGGPAMPTSMSSGDGLGTSEARRSGSGSSGGEQNLEREALKQKHEEDIKARAGEKLAAVREREGADAKERSQKDSARAATERRINSWTGNGTRRGNLRALLASLDSILYPSSTWKPVTMDDLKAPTKVKANYHRAILQVHPDKVGPKNLPPDQQVLAELIFDELQNGYEVWTAEQEGRPPPPGSVGPKNAPASGGAGFGGGQSMNNMAGMYAQQQQSFGRGGMNFNPMGGMGMGGFSQQQSFQQQNGMGGGMGGMKGMGNMSGMNQNVGSGLGRGMPAGMYGAGNGGMYNAGRGNQQQRR